MSKVINKKSGDSEKYLNRPQNITIEQLHPKIIDELNWLRDIHDHNVKPRNILSNGHYKEVGVLQETGVICKFCPKEGCRLHYLIAFG